MFQELQNAPSTIMDIAVVLVKAYLSSFQEKLKYTLIIKIFLYCKE